MSQLHFHVRQNDVGYMPDPDNVYTYVAVDDAIEDALQRLDDHADAMSQLDPGEAIRGQPHATEPWTAGEEVTDTEAMISNTRRLMADHDFSLVVAQEGLMYPIEMGVAVIVIDPCSEASCEEYRDEWIT